MTFGGAVVWRAPQQGRASKQARGRSLTFFLGMGDVEAERKDPSGRYHKSGTLVEQSRGTRHVYKAFDTETAVEVAWQEYWNLSIHVINAMERQISVLKELNHPNVVKYHEGWVDRKEKKVILITEAMPSGKGSISNVRKFLSRSVHMKPGVLVGWLWQVLSGLHFLHSQTPSLIHRDLRCENIYIRSNVGRVKIGGLELGVFMQSSHPAEISGTPGYMPLDLVNTEPDRLSDVYSFGMCALEMFTAKYPYSECLSPYEIFAKQIRGEYPEAILGIQEPSVVDMIERCLDDRDVRPSTDDLLRHELFREHSAAEQEYPLTELPPPERHASSREETLKSVFGGAALASSAATAAPVATPLKEECAAKPPLDLSESVVGDNIKCYTEDKSSCIRIFYEDIVSIDSLRSIISQDLDIPLDSLRIKYVDTDKDVVNVTQRTTVMELVRYAQCILAAVRAT